ncbi:MAG: SAM-dependent methyltransferase [Cryomorphaceae bacterium]|nr:SAM-dependent methyltransferase [Cryomorphaceae bacterium]
MDEQKQKGVLYVVPTFLSDTQALGVLPMSVKKIVENLRHFIVENEKTARKNIKKIAPNLSQSEIIIHPLNKFTPREEYEMYLNPCLQGAAVGIMSEAGCPGVADPGAEIVALAHEKGIRVIPLVGPSSILLSLMASGLNGQSFSFLGYLPIEKNERRIRIKEIETNSRRYQQTQIFIETPYRNVKFLKELLRHCKSDTKLCVACDITSQNEEIKTQPISVWEKEDLERYHKRPTIFLLLATP